MAGVKISGNAQQRKRTHFLHHGTLLCGFDLSLIAKYLNAPERQPEYRRDRPHAEFVTNLPATVAQVKRLLIAEWQPEGEYAPRAARNPYANSSRRSTLATSGTGGGEPATRHTDCSPVHKHAPTTHRAPLSIPLGHPDTPIATVVVQLDAKGTSAGAVPVQLAPAPSLPEEPQ